MHYSHRAAFTLVELLVVIAVIALLLALLLPAVHAARNAVRKMSCQNNMRQTGLAIHHYLETNGAFPPANAEYKYAYTKPDTMKVVEVEVGHNLITFLLPFMEQISAYELYHFDENWQNDLNDATTERRIPIILCPASSAARWCRYGPGESTSHRRIVEFFVSDYTACDPLDKNTTDTPRAQLKSMGIVRADWRPILLTAAKDTRGMANSFAPTTQDIFAMVSDNAVSAGAVTDGLSNTFLLFECTDRPKKFIYGQVAGDPDVTLKEPLAGARWADNESLIWIHKFCGSGAQFINCSNERQIFSMHTGGCNFLYGDGSVRFHFESMPPDIFVSLFTAYADESVSPP